MYKINFWHLFSPQFPSIPFFFSLFYSVFVSWGLFLSHCIPLFYKSSHVIGKKSFAFNILDFSFGVLSFCTFQNYLSLYSRWQTRVLHLLTMGLIWFMDFPYLLILLRIENKTLATNSNGFIDVFLLELSSFTLSLESRKLIWKHTIFQST